MADQFNLMMQTGNKYRDTKVFRLKVIVSWRHRVVR